MSITRALMISVVVVAVGCKGKSDSDKAGGGGGAATGPRTMTAAELFADKDNMKGKQVVVSGPVKSLYGSTSLTVMLVAGDHVVDLEFADNGEAAKGKNLKEGDPVTAECKVGGTSMDGNDLLTSGCVLR